MQLLLGFCLVFSFLSCCGTAILAFLKIKEVGIRRILKPTEELADFLGDVRKSGYGLVRVDPDSVMRRSPR